MAVPAQVLAALLLKEGIPGNGFSDTVCDPFITAAQFPPSATICAV
jgi:hypothetical protein